MPSQAGLLAWLWALCLGFQLCEPLRRLLEHPHVVAASLPPVSSRVRARRKQPWGLPGHTYLWHILLSVRSESLKSSSHSRAECQRMCAHICIFAQFAYCPPRAGPSINQSCCKLPLGEGTCPPGVSGLGGSVSQDYPPEKDMMGTTGGGGGVPAR